MTDYVSVNPDRLDQVTRRLEALRDGLAANVALVTTMMSQYAQQGGDVPGLARMLAQAQARSVRDAADMRARTQLAYRAENTPVNFAAFHGQGSLDESAMLSIPWDMQAVDQQAALADAQELRDAMDSKDSGERIAKIQQAEQDIMDHLAEGQGGLAYLSAFYDKAGAQVAGLASVLYSWDGTLKQPLSVRDQQTLNIFATGLAYVLKNGTGNTALTAQAMGALTNAPDMWSVAMLVKYGPDAKAYGTGAGANLLHAVSTSTVQISPHVIVPANDPAVPELRAAWAWAAKRPVYLASTAGDAEFTRWVGIATVSPFRDLFKGQLYREFASMTPDFRIEGAFTQNENVLITTGGLSTGLGAVVFFNDPRSLLGAPPEEVEKLVPPGWTGPRPLRTGKPGWRYFDEKGRLIAYEEGDPSDSDLGRPDSLLHRGPYYKIAENRYIYRIAAFRNPTLADPNAITISIEAPDGTKVYLNQRMPTDVPGDEVNGAGGDDLGDGAGGGDAAAPGE
ncbi:MAG: hypothetical protein JOY82_15840 [Streptosporangiaceae bacterium]|nr:hypothetical protein [Streptosporangiaceae bacterium]